MMGTVAPRRERLAHRLREVRESTGLSGRRFAEEKLGWPQSKVSRIETGAQMPSDEDVQAWAQAAGAAPDVATALFDMLAAVKAEYLATRDLIRRGEYVTRQSVLAELESCATRFAEYQPSLIPGLAQTAAYARAMLELPGLGRSKGASDEVIAGVVAGRIRRQDLLYEPDRRIQLLIGEAALLSMPGGTDVRVGQLEKLASVTGLGTVEVGVIPLRAGMVAPPLSGFRLLDDDLVITETLAGEQHITDPDEVQAFADVLAALRAAAATGDDAVDLIRSLR